MGGPLLPSKRKRSPLVDRVVRKRHSIASSNTWKQGSKHAAHSTKQGKRFLSRGAPPPSRPLARKVALKTQLDAHGIVTRYNNGGENSNGSSMEDGGRIQYSTKNQLKSTCELERNRGSLGEDSEYEIEQILRARLLRGKLQYRADWIGYAVDPKWYDASNFKDTPGQS
ncbi:hypothetical protein GQ44DRAFT_455518 [Phaeosphaeriaceae sp. PMI808]|nr:hypothetical protein GQ44DRAFT_455518 [Phaeosphaeriaceae sp. PMI808]